MREFLDECLGSRTKTVLIAEDQLTVQAILELQLQFMGFDHVLKAMTGEEALDIYYQRKEEIALVISDVQMPGMNGDELFWELVRSGEAVRMLLCSGYCNSIDISKLLKAGLKGCIQKPFHKETLEFGIVQAFSDSVR